MQVAVEVARALHETAAACRSAPPSPAEAAPSAAESVKRRDFFHDVTPFVMSDPLPGRTSPRQEVVFRLLCFVGTDVDTAALRPRHRRRSRSISAGNVAVQVGPRIQAGEPSPIWYRVSRSSLQGQRPEAHLDEVAALVEGRRPRNRWLGCRSRSAPRPPLK